MPSRKTEQRLRSGDERAKAKGLQLSGTFHTATCEFAVANTAGVRATTSTDAFFRTISTGDHRYADRLTRDVRETIPICGRRSDREGYLYPEAITWSRTLRHHI